LAYGAVAQESALLTKPSASAVNDSAMTPVRARSLQIGRALGMIRLIKLAESGARSGDHYHLAARCHRAAIEGRWAATMRFFAGPRLLVIDEVGYLPLPAEGGAALFQVISQRYLRGSVILTTDLGIASWGRIFDDPSVAAAMLDRLLHRSVVFNIDGTATGCGPTRRGPRSSERG
jgi:hypothetical protein